MLSPGGATIIILLSYSSVKKLLSNYYFLCGRFENAARNN